MSKDTTDEQMKHYNKIIDEFDSAHMPAKQREIIMTEIEQLISNREKLARLEQYDKSVEVMKDILAENFHYRLMCGEIKDPSGKIDVNKAFVEYQELEPERQKFSNFIEARLTTLRKELDGEEPTNE